jgi:hypothetical protein
MKSISCPICNASLQILQLDDKNYTDYNCYADSNSHYFGKRLVNDYITIIKVSVKSNQNSLYARVNYLTNSSEIWSDDSLARIKIDAAISFDFSSIQSIKDKIQTYILFS